MPILQERQDKNTIKVFMKHSISSAVRFLQTLAAGCLQQDVVNKNLNFKIKSGSFLIRLGAGATCIYIEREKSDRKLPVKLSASIYRTRDAW